MEVSQNKAVVHLSRSDEESTRLKRLALLFDEIHFIRPSFAVIDEEALEAREKEAEAEGSSPEKIELDVLDDIYHGIQLISVGEELQNTLAALEEADIAIDCTNAVSDSTKDSPYRRWRDPFLIDAAWDEEWNALTETSEEAYSDPEIARINLTKLDTGEDLSLLGIDVPAALEQAGHIAAAGYVAREIKGHPLFDDDLQKLLRYKYQQYSNSLNALKEAGIGFDLADYRTRFGKAAFAIANSVFSSDSLRDQSIEDILRFRSEMDLARRELLSRDLMELTDLIAGNPWSHKAEEEVEKFTRGKLAGDVAKFDADSISTWEKLYGSLAVRAGSIAQASGIGGGAGGVAGHLLPQTSFWGMLLSGLLIGASKEAPGVVNDVLEAVRADRERQRTGIAYIARFNERA